MMLVEQTTISGGDLPIVEFKDHLRLGTGFADDDVQNGVLEPALRAAIATVEAHVSKATIARDYEWCVTAWRDFASQTLPIAPVASLDALTIVDRMGDAEVVDPSRYMLLPDTHRPRLATTGFCLPPIPVGGKAVIAFSAGYGPSWAFVPADMAQAIMMLAAQYYENRSSFEGRDQGLPSQVALLLERHRDFRLFGGGRA